ncbi:MAG: hypothetical protein IKN04_04040 [Clostridia bacterium]|nr:hypothetical protein [Clostridia bacterium]
MEGKTEIMEKEGTAYFIKYPRVIEDLLVLHDVSDEARYEIVKEIRLQPIDYENFYTDMTVERQYIEDSADLCDDGEIKKCLFVHGRSVKEGILVLPDPSENAYVGWAAYIREA